MTNYFSWKIMSECMHSNRHENENLKLSRDRRDIHSIDMDLS